MKAALKMYKDNPVKDIAKFPFAREEYRKLKNHPVTSRLSAEEKGALEGAESYFRGQQSRRDVTIDEILVIWQFDRGDVERVFDHFKGNKGEILNHLFEQMEL